MKLQNVVLAAVIAVLTVGCSQKTPAELAKIEAAELRSKQQAADIINSVVAQEVSCGDVVAEEKAFDRKSGDPRIYVYVDKLAKKIECFDGPGYHPVWGDTLVEITKAQVKVIRANEGNCYPVTPPKCCVTPAPVAAPVPPPPPPVAPIVSTPLPELGTGPCCGRQ